MRSRRELNLLYTSLPTLVLVITATALVLAAIAFRSVRTHLIEFAGESLALAASDIADKLDLVLYERYSDVQVFAKTLATHHHQTDELSQTLIEWQQVHSLYLWIGVTDAAGRVMAATEQQSLGHDYSQDAWFQAVRDRGEPYAEDAHVSEKAGGRLAVSFAAPIHGADKQFLGAVTARVGLPSLETILARTVRLFLTERRISGEVEWLLTASDGRVLADSTLGPQSQIHHVEPVLLPSAFLLTAAIQPGYVEEVHAKRRVPVLTGYARTEGYGRFRGFQWGVLVRLPRADVVAPIRKLLWQLGSAAVLVGGPMFAFLLWTSMQLRKEWKGAQDRENRLATTLASITDAVFVTDREGRISSLNRAAEALTEWPEQEAIGKPLAEVVALTQQAPSRRPVDNPVLRALREGVSVALPAEVSLLTRNKKARAVEGNSAPIRDLDGDFIGGLLVLRDVTARGLVERRRAAQYEVTRALAESSSLADAAPRILQAVCESLDWDEGALWRVDAAANRLRCVALWHKPSRSYPEFDKVTRETTFAPGIGLPGRVWSSGNPAWIPDVCQDDNFPRAPIAKREGLHAAFGFPIVTGGTVFGVLEFFSHEIRQPDPDLFELLRATGAQIGQFCQRKELEAKVRDRPQT
ncbi:MAG: PAS domain-containing protein [Nitrospirota bacterium]